MRNKAQATLNLDEVFDFVDGRHKPHIPEHLIEWKLIKGSKGEILGVDI